MPGTLRASVALQNTFGGSEHGSHTHVIMRAAAVPCTYPGRRRALPCSYSWAYGSSTEPGHRLAARRCWGRRGLSHWLVSTCSVWLFKLAFCKKHTHSCDVLSLLNCQSDCSVFRPDVHSWKFWWDGAAFSTSNVHFLKFGFLALKVGGGGATMS